MDRIASPVSHSKHIAMWRLYLWIQFLETKDASQFVIDEDIVMARKAKNRLNRIDVYRHLYSIVKGVEIHEDQCATSLKESLLIKLRGDTYEYTDEEKKTIESLKNNIIVSYAHIKNNNEISVNTSKGEPRPITGKDFLDLFDGKIRIYNNRKVIAKKDASGYCCLYYSEKGKISPIIGNEAKIIGSEILADIADKKTKNMDSAQAILVQSYQSTGKLDLIAEYYTQKFRSEQDIKIERPLLSQNAIRRNIIFKPLIDFKTAVIEKSIKVKDGLQDPKFISTSIDEIIKICNKEIKNEKKLEYTVKKYLCGLKQACTFKLENEYTKYFRATTTFSSKLIHKYRKNPFHEIDAAIINMCSDYNDDYKETDNEDIQSSIEIFKSHMKNAEITIDLTNADESLSENSSKPELIIMKRNDNMPFLYLPNEVASNRLAISIGKINRDSIKIKIDDSNMAQDFGSIFELKCYNNSSLVSKRFIYGTGLRANNTADDIYSLADFLKDYIIKQVPKSISSKINYQTIAKISYMIMVAGFHQGSFQFQALTHIITHSQKLLLEAEMIKKFCSINIDDNGLMVIKITYTTKPFKNELKNDKFELINETVAVQSILSVNLLDEKPVFMMKQKAEAKIVGDISPDAFFIEGTSSDPTPSLPKNNKY